MSQGGMMPHAKFSKKMFANYCTASRRDVTGRTYLIIFYWITHLRGGVRKAGNFAFCREIAVAQRLCRDMCAM